MNDIDELQQQINRQDDEIRNLQQQIDEVQEFMELQKKINNALSDFVKNLKEILEKINGLLT